MTSNLTDEIDEAAAEAFRAADSIGSLPASVFEPKRSTPLIASCFSAGQCLPPRWDI